MLLFTSIFAVTLVSKIPGGSPVLGFLLGGAAVGPYMLGFVDHVAQAKVLAEFGVVFLLFTSLMLLEKRLDARFGGFLDYLVASTEYTAFVELMRDFRGERRDVSRWWLPRGGRRQ